MTYKDKILSKYGPNRMFAWFTDSSGKDHVIMLHDWLIKYFGLDDPYLKQYRK